MRFLAGIWSNERDRDGRTGLRKYDQWRENWILAIPLYDARQCPECGALCVGKEAKWAHRNWHMEMKEWFEGTNRNILIMAKKLELPIGEQEEIDDNTESEEKDNSQKSDGYVL